MKFDFIIGNPPYQDETTGENKTFAPSIYHKFMDSCFPLATAVELIHPARFLFAAGDTPKQWNEKMLHNKHFKVLWYEADGKKVFQNTDIKGGVAITYHNAEENFGEIGIFTAFPELNSILHKVIMFPAHLGSIMSIIFMQNRFNLDILYEDYPEFKKIIGSDGKDRRFRNNIFEKINLFRDEKENADDIAVLGVVKNKRVWKYIPKKYVDFEHENLTLWKIFVPAANGSGALGEVLSTPLIGAPLIGATQSFISIGKFHTEKEAHACLKYIKSKLARVMLGVLKVTQHNPKDTWEYVPMQDFTSTSDIDWSKSVAEIDRQLYAKYGLDEQEIAFIEKNVKEMD